MKDMRCDSTGPYKEVNGKSVLIFRDAPHLLKSAQNFLHKAPISVPGFACEARWFHIEDLYKKDCQLFFKMVPKLKARHVGDLKFQNKMKVKLATQTLSHSCSAALNTLIAMNDFD